ncbi:Mov34/MPN/PAD-1 family protein [Methylomicrobium sp. RS1]|jgi:proteasome lid subunit RPN8/RPN11|uniref:Mov34/MPN/PAD-1 family protein n=1 Tax=Candidatus Methylomicrobium oryzae TaxID=2802053 RepID=UPI001920ECE1|nr:M67 family metallopeptidase [Methylomicrobium sp. RS1]MBL1262130.1 M67 family metallopeptidase [Methylomicrobium sp. RS1]
MHEQQEIHIPRKLAQQLLHLAQISPDTEICGLVGGKNGIAQTCYPIINVAEHPERRFLLDPKQQIAAMAAMRDQGEELFAIYHSHPAAPAFPSGTDLEQAAYPETSYLIISLNTKGILEMRGFRIAAQTANEIRLVLTEN